MIRLIATDMDGTLLDGNHQISPENIAAIRAAQQQGIKFVIATGRIMADVQAFIESYGLAPYYLTMNGAELHAPDHQLLHSAYIDHQRSQKIYEIIAQFQHFNLEIYTDQGHFSANSRLKTYRGLLDRMREVRPGTNFLKNFLWSLKNPHFKKLQYIKDFDEFWQSDINIAKFITFSRAPGRLAALAERLENEVPNLAISASFRTNIEINDAAATKGNTLKVLTKSLGIAEEEVLVLGDGTNDLSMFEAFPSNATAMENGVAKLKEAAAHITKDNLHNGVAAAIQTVLS